MVCSTHFKWFTELQLGGADGDALHGKAKNPAQWLNNLIDVTQAYPHAKEKLLYELQAKDWRTGKPIPTNELSAWMRNMRVKGILNFGYYPDDQFTNSPNIKILKKELSAKAVFQ
nr:poly-beta-1,6-N-acetyl-D-glucosamine N-deacetylase PgaB [Polynucleobacter necessarius]